VQSVTVSAAPAEQPIVPRYLSPKNASRYTGIAVKTLESLRRSGFGPSFSVAGRSILYDRLDLDSYLAARRVANTAQAIALQAKGGAR
jgi:hypothetical protein